MNLSELINFQSNRNRLDDIIKNRKNIVPFIGTGISKGCGLYTWAELLHELAVDYLTDDEISSLEEKGDFFDYADQIVEVSGNSDMIMKRIREIFSEATVSCTEIPYLLVSMFSSMVITTNYDTLLEDASRNSLMGPLKPLLPCLMGQMNEAIQVNARNLLKIHGSVEETQSFVFTRKQYKKFYGEKGNRDNRLIPAYLMKIFSGKKVLFVGCSLERDYTLEILEECIQQNNSISHFAIVPYPRDSSKQIKRKRELTRLGIEPIYYPEGDFQAVNKLINYLSEENHFISSMRQILIDNVGVDNKYEFEILLSILKQSFYKTTLKFSQLLDIDNMKKDFTRDILGGIGSSRHQTDTILGICKEAFWAYIKIGYLRCEREVANYFSAQLENAALMESEIESLLEKKWSIERSLLNIKERDLTWTLKLSDEEINDYADALLQKLQYKNGMNFADIVPAYEMAKQLIEFAADRINFDIKIRLMNSIGGFGHYFSDSEKAIKYLEKCISEIDDCGRTDRKLMLFKAKCYANLAINRSLSNTSLSLVLEAVEKDIYLKKRYKESDLLYSRSLNFYATVLKEIDPFAACDIYFEVVYIKEKLISGVQEREQVRELTASWATTVFNIGLLAKDLELYELAYRLIHYANKYRFETVNYCNRDYCSSVNVCAELEIFVHSKQNLKWLIDGVESRVDLPIGFSETLSHTWYICAFYYFLKEEYAVAIKYINKSIGASNKKGSLVDFRQDVRTQILYGDIKSVLDKIEGQTVYMNAIKSVKSIYGEESYYLLLPYRHLIQMQKTGEKKSGYFQRYQRLYEKYVPVIRDVEVKLEKYLIEHDA